MQLPDLLTEARQLLGILVSSLKDNDVLEQRAIEKQQNTHYPGTFPPWVVSGMERWSRYISDLQCSKSWAPETSG
jgi:hypothetical protein